MIFLRAIKYEINLQVLKNKRKERLGLKKIGKCDFAGETRIHTLFHRALKRYTGDKKLWLQYIDLCMKSRSRRVLSKVFANALKLFPKDVGFWIYAASYEFEVCLNMNAARAILQRAVRMNGKVSKKIWIEFVRLECLYVLKLQERQKILGVEAAEPKPTVVETEPHVPAFPDIASGSEDDEEENGAEANDDTRKAAQITLPPTSQHTSVLAGAIPQIIYEKAIENFPNDLQFALEIAHVMIKTGLPDLGLKIIETQCKSNPSSSAAWRELATAKKLDARARCELLETAFKKYKSPELFEAVIDELHDRLTRDGQTPAIREKLDVLFATGSDLGCMSPKSWQLYVQHCVSLAKWDQVEEISQKALKQFPGNCDLTGQRAELILCRTLQQMRTTNSQIFASSQKYDASKLSEDTSPWATVAQELVSLVHSVNTQTDTTARTRLWLSLLSLACLHAPSLESIDELLLTNPNELPDEFLVAYFEMITHTIGLNVMRKKVDQLSKRLVKMPLGVILHCIDAEIASSQPKLSYVRHLFESAVTKYNNEDVWLRYIKFELDFKHPEFATALHWRAVRALKNSESFSRRYDLLK
eukprot:c7803_g1_i2.p1 GENE.c7803_g1_i2~~c7803_g1_i2.p1  ORF type:complete len:587 (+),score=155.28 c7803_g1_i2:206-1966(+)